jgi:glycosyltransferase involved in cell wall biosynthesis
MNSAAQPLVSIVTPMYNEAEHVAECIESILSQTYQNWEYVVVDNCSTDGSPEIVRRYADKDHRVRLLQNSQFLQAIPNHNAALRQISPTSKYCKIVFADDWIFPECLERMVDVAEKHPSVGLVGAYGLEGQQVVWTGLPYPSTVVPGNDVCRRLFLDGLYVFGTATSVLYRADLVRRREAFFEAANIHADMEVCVFLLKNSDFGFVHQVLTYTRVRAGSLITMSRNINTLAASKLKQLVRHGPHFLSTREFATCLNRSLSEYYWYLAGSFVRGREKSFWNFHRETLREAGVGFSRARLARAVFTRLCFATFNLKENIERLLKVKSNKSQASDSGAAEVQRAPAAKYDAVRP